MNSTLHRTRILLTYACFTLGLGGCINTTEVSSISTDERSPVAYALLSDLGFLPRASIEVVRLDTMKQDRVVDLGNYSLYSIAVDIAHNQIFATDILTYNVLAFDSLTGTLLKKFDTVQVPTFARILLSADGKTVYVPSVNGLTEIDTATLELGRTLPLTDAEDYPIDLAISSDGKTLAVESYASALHVELIDLPTWTHLKGSHRIELSAEYCALRGGRMAFGPDSRLLVADSNCLHVVNTQQSGQVSAVDLGRELISSVLGFLLFDSVSGTALQSKGTGGFDVIRLDTLGSSRVTLPGDINLTAAAPFNGDVLVSAGGDSFDTTAGLYRYETKTGKLSEAPVYTLSVSGLLVTALVTTHP
jgi:hypothetical protein